MTSALQPPAVALSYQVRPDPEAWVLPEVPVPEARIHDLVLVYLNALLTAWIARTGADLIVARNLAVRWIEHKPKVGADPDLCVLKTPPEGNALTSLRLWETGHEPPLVAIEVVSARHPYKDYDTIQDRYAACGAGELWVFDPLLCGPRTHGGPFSLQLWRADEQGVLARAYTGVGPVYSAEVQAWLRVVDGDELKIFDDQECTRPWLTAEQAALAEVERLKQRLRELEGG